MRLRPTDPPPCRHDDDDDDDDADYDDDEGRLQSNDDVRTKHKCLDGENQTSLKQSVSHIISLRLTNR